jgi:hypothetical protein
MSLRYSTDIIYIIIRVITPSVQQWLTSSCVDAAKRSPPSRGTQLQGRLLTIQTSISKTTKRRQRVGYFLHSILAEKILCAALSNFINHSGVVNMEYTMPLKVGFS